LLCLALLITVDTDRIERRHMEMLSDLGSAAQGKDIAGSFALASSLFALRRQRLIAAGSLTALGDEMGLEHERPESGILKRPVAADAAVDAPASGRARQPSRYNAFMSALSHAGLLRRSQGSEVFRGRTEFYRAYCSDPDLRAELDGAVEKAKE